MVHLFICRFPKAGVIIISRFLVIHILVIQMLELIKQHVIQMLENSLSTHNLSGHNLRWLIKLTQISLLKLAMMGICIDRLNQPDTLYLEKGANLMLRSSGEYFTIVLALWVHILVWVLCSEMLNQMVGLLG